MCSVRDEDIIYLISLSEHNKREYFHRIFIHSQEMGKRKFNAKGRQVVDTIIDNTATKQVSRRDEFNRKHKTATHTTALDKIGHHRWWVDRIRRIRSIQCLSASIWEEEDQNQEGQRQCHENFIEKATEKFGENRWQKEEKGRGELNWNNNQTNWQHFLHNALNVLPCSVLLCWTD